MSLSLQIVDGNYARPAAGVPVTLWREAERQFTAQDYDVTNDEGVMPAGFGSALSQGRYRLEFNLERYFATLGIRPLLPAIMVDLRVTRDASAHRLYLVIMPAAYLVGLEVR